MIAFSNPPVSSIELFKSLLEGSSRIIGMDHEELIGSLTRLQLTMAKATPKITGFDMKKLVAASGMPANDPWRRQYELALGLLIALMRSIVRPGDTQDRSLWQIDGATFFQASE